MAKIMIAFDYDIPRIVEMAGGDDHDYRVPEGILEVPGVAQEDLEAALAAYDHDRTLWDRIRVERDARLAECDWTQLPDAPLNTEQRQAWAQYRQELRDLPQAGPGPDSVAWPSPPK